MMQRARVRWNSSSVALPLVRRVDDGYSVELDSYFLHAFRRLDFAMTDAFPDEWRRDLCAWASANQYVQQLWLFGSRADGTARPDSDVDIGLGLMPPSGNGNSALGAFLALSESWQRQLEAIVGRHVSLDRSRRMILERRGCGSGC
jgi:predicted nucleotidyltransferase